MKNLFSTLIVLLFCAMQVQAQNLKEYVGNYEVTQGQLETLEVYIENDKLYGEAPYQERSVLEATEVADVFLVKEYNGKLIFNRNDEKIVTSLELFVQGMEIMATRKMAPLEDFEGNYLFTEGPISEMLISVEDGQVMADVPEVGKGPIAKTSIQDQFLGESYQSDILFTRNDNGLVDSVEISVQGMLLLGAKEMKMESPYVGLYAFEAGSPIDEVEVYEENGKLYGASSQGEAQLIPTSKPGVFEVEGYEGTCTFEKDADGAVSKMTLIIQGQEMNAYKN